MQSKTVEQLAAEMRERMGPAILSYTPRTTIHETPLYDCPDGCGLLTSTPAQLCSCCNEMKPAAHWDGLVDTCGDCAGSQYGE